MARKANKPANIVGPQIRHFRKGLKMTQEQLAARCQVSGLDFSRSTLGQIEAQLRCVNDEELFRLASILGVTTDDLFYIPKKGLPFS